MRETCQNPDWRITETLDNTSNSNRAGWSATLQLPSSESALQLGTWLVALWIKQFKKGWLWSWVSIVQISFLRAASTQISQVGKKKWQITCLTAQYLAAWRLRQLKLLVPFDKYRFNSVLLNFELLVQFKLAHTGLLFVSQCADFSRGYRLTSCKIWAAISDVTEGGMCWLINIWRLGDQARWQLGDWLLVQSSLGFISRGFCWSDVLRVLFNALAGDAIIPHWRVLVKGCLEDPVSLRGSPLRIFDSSLLFINDRLWGLSPLGPLILQLVGGPHILVQHEGGWDTNLLSSAHF